MPIRTGTFRVPLPGEPGDYGLSPWEYTVADLFHDANYATACYGKWHLGNVPGRFPTDQGFDEWWGISESSDEASYAAHPLYPDDWHKPKILESRRGEAPSEFDDFDLATRPLMDERITERTIEFMTRSAAENRPFFVYTSFTNLHPPMIAHPDFAYAESAYSANVAELDARAGQILDALHDLGLADDTIVVWASDNAATEAMGSSSAAWRGKFGGGWEGSIRAPAMIRWPGRVPAGVVSDQIVATYDWLPTLAAMAMESDLVPTDRPIDGVNMSAFMCGESDESGRDAFIFLGSDGKPVSVKWKTMKVHFRVAMSDSWTAPLLQRQIPAIYDLANDPGEEIDLMDTELTVSWVIRSALAPIVALEQSAIEHPHISPGAEFTGYD